MKFQETVAESPYWCGEISYRILTTVHNLLTKARNPHTIGSVTHQLVSGKPGGGPPRLCVIMLHYML